MSMQGLLDNGDEVLSHADYPLGQHVSLAGGNVVHYLCDEEANWYPDIETRKSKKSPQILRLSLSSTPNNQQVPYPDEILLSDCRDRSSK